MGATYRALAELLLRLLERHLELIVGVKTVCRSRPELLGSVR
jgi:hypothetical protein